MIDPKKLIGYADEIDNRTAPLSGGFADLLARELRAAAATVRALDQQVMELNDIIRELLDAALPDNWDDCHDPAGAAAWRKVIIAAGEDPADYASGDDEASS